LLQFVLVPLDFTFTQNLYDVVLHAGQDALEHGMNVFADNEVPAQVEPLGGSDQFRSRLTEETVTLMQIPLRTPIEERGASARHLHIEVFRKLALLYLAHVELHAHIVTRRVAVFFVACNPIL
jgi:hypothetical protein